MLLFFMDKVLGAGSFLDYGMFLQSIMLAAVEQGLATCPQASLTDYADIIREEVGYPNDKLLLCGMALGYEDTSESINAYRTPRETIDSFVTFFN